MHPYLTHTIASERIERFQREASRRRLAASTARPAARRTGLLRDLAATLVAPFRPQPQPCPC